MNVALPYLRAIELHISDRFPNRKVRVFSEDSPFRPGFVAIKALVDNCGAYVTLDPNVGCNEWYVTDILIGKLEEVLEGSDASCT